jgi:multidrug efflux pump subunit AcrA (membrane-fusion protein)
MKNHAERLYSSAAAAAAAALISGALAACSTPAVAGASVDTADPVAVTTARAVMTDVATAIDSDGVVQARTTAVIMARLVAPVREVRVLPGDHVRRGQTLAVLDGDDLVAAARAVRSAAVAADEGTKAAAAELQAAEAALTLARASHDRIAGLEARRSATAQELDEAVAMLRSAEARVAGASARALQARAALDGARAASDQAKITASFTTIVAPFDGVVTEKMVEPGNMASPDRPLLRLEDTSRFRLEVRVDESRAEEIRNGASVPVFLGTAASPVDGTVVEVSRAVDSDARAFVVKIALPDVPGLRSGAFGKARFSASARRGLTIPASAIVRRGQLTSAFVVDNGRARVRLVNVSESEVLAGLTESELVILSPPAGLVDGRRVTVGGR